MFPVNYLIVKLVLKPLVEQYFQKLIGQLFGSTEIIVTEC